MGGVIDTPLRHIERVATDQLLQAKEDAVLSTSARARLLLTENAASQSRLAAALSHELNSPVGALNSTLQTLLLLFQKRKSPPRIRPLGRTFPRSRSHRFGRVSPSENDR